MTNPWVILAIVLAFIGVGVGGAALGVRYEKGQEAREEVLIAKASDASQRAAAVEIGKIQITQTTIRQKAQETIREVPVYRDCIHSPDVFRLLNEAATNGAKTVGDRKLPDVDAP